MEMQLGKIIQKKKKVKDKAMGVEQESILPLFPGKYRKGRET